MTKKIGIFYGSDTGHTEEVAKLIQELLGSDNADLYDVKNVDDASILASYDLVLLGTSTWYLGELQSDMDTFKDKFDGVDLKGKTFALFGLGDQVGYSDYYLDGMGRLYHLLKDKGVNFIGNWSTEGYDFTSTLALSDEDNSKFIGLALDEDNQSDLTPERIAIWLEQVKAEAGIEI